LQIIGGPASQMLASRIARELNVNVSLCEFTKFPDGELYTRIVDDIAEEVTIIQSIVKDSDLINLLQLIDSCESSKRINVVIPYMGYSRQDKKFKHGEPISSRAIANTINADCVFTVNIHEKSTLDYFSCKAIDIDASSLIGDKIVSLDLEKPLLIAPDEGALELAKKVSEYIDVEFDYLEKTRISGDKVTIKTKKIDVTGRDIILIDDMISTGGTMAESIRILSEQRANDVYLMCIHPVLAKNAVLRLFNAGVKDIFATDSIETAQSSISLSPILSNYIL